MRFACFVAAFIVAGCQSAKSSDAPEPSAADLLLHSGSVLVLNEPGTTATAMAVKDGKVLAIGSNELRDRYIADITVDLAGRTIMPGFIDTHVHIDGRPPWYIDLTKLDSIEALSHLIRAKAKALEPGAWITGYGWSEDELGRKPTNEDLDDAAPGHPIMLTRAGAHSAVFSSRALELSGIDRDTPDPEGGAIERNEDGSLNGIVRERHGAMVAHLLPQASPDELRHSLRRQLQALFALGVTSITQATGSPASYAEWTKLYADHRGELPRAVVQIQFSDKGPDAEVGELREFGKITGDGDAHLRVGPIKLFVDGGFTGPAAYTKSPYKGEASYRGHLNMSEADLERQIATAHRLGWQLGIHAIGDAAIELVVAKLDKALNERPKSDHRHYLNHFTVMPSAKTMNKMAELDIAITQQPNFLYTLEGRYRDYLDGARLEHNNPVATPMSHGIHVAMSSDILPLGPWVGIYAATTRKGPSGQVYGPSERISRLAALRAYTAHGAYLTRDEASKGQLLPGMVADFIVLTQNPLTVEDNELLDIKTEATYLSGQRVFQHAASN